MLISVPVLAQSGVDEPPPADTGDTAVLAPPPATSTPATENRPSNGEDGWIASLAMKNPAVPAMGIARRLGERGLARVETGMFGAHVEGSADLEATLLRAGPLSLAAGVNGTVHYFPLGVDGNSMTAVSAWGVGPEAGLTVSAGKVLLSGDAAMLRGRIGTVESGAIGRRGSWLPAVTLRVGLAL